MCYNGCYYYPCIHMPGTFSYGYGPVWSTPEYTVYSPSDSSSTISVSSSVSSSSARATAGSYRYATVAEEEERLRARCNERRRNNASSSADDVYNVSVRYRSSGHSSSRRSRSSSPSNTIPASMLPPTYYAFVPTSRRRRVRVSLYD
ncbi:hypothetical protein Sste5346_006748 [Sporothrix stenoceras]|uniref:Uncharacterized protein n=1 Tax=Sporothrix stenoceras TaxID=5173 RepID=A0ABR3YY70_9PEZI